MTKKEKLQRLAMLKSDKAVIEMEIKELQLELLSDREEDFDLDGIRVYERSAVRYNFRKEFEEEFEREYPHLVTKKFLTTEVSKEDKLKYFKKSISKPYLMFE